MIPKYFKYLKIAAVATFAVMIVGVAEASAQRRNVTVRFQTGIYRDWDHSWMTTAPRDVVANIKTSRGFITKSPSNYSGTVVFNNVPCGETVSILIRFVGSAAYRSFSRTYSKSIPCGRGTVNLGRLEYGRW